MFPISSFFSKTAIPNNPNQTSVQQPPESATSNHLKQSVDSFSLSRPRVKAPLFGSGIPSEDSIARFREELTRDGLSGHDLIKEVAKFRNFVNQGIAQRHEVEWQRDLDNKAYNERLGATLKEHFEERAKRQLELEKSYERDRSSTSPQREPKSSKPRE